MLVHCWWEYILVQPLWKTVWIFLKTLQMELLYDPEILLLGIYLKKKPKNSGLKRHMHNVHRSITYSFQGVQSNLTVDPQTNG